MRFQEACGLIVKLTQAQISLYHLLRSKASYLTSLSPSLFISEMGFGD